MDITAEQLPEDVLALLQQHEEEKILKLEAFSAMVSKKRDEAVVGRANSGCEDVWTQDEEFYLGIDDANRGHTGMLKPSHPSGGFIQSKPKNDSRSTLFLNITRPYVDAIVARTCDILLPTDDLNWGIEPTRIPTLVVGQDPQQQPNAQPQAMPAMGAPAGAVQPAPAPVPPAAVDPIIASSNQARDSADLAQRRIGDWLDETGYNDENRKVIFDSAKLGSGVLKGPCPKQRKTSAVSQTPEGVTMTMALEIKPASTRVDPWNFYPDPACGENIHDGNYVFEKDYLTAKALRDLKGSPGYLSDQIDAALEEGPKGRDSSSGNPNRSRFSDKDLYEVWYGYMSVGIEDLSAAGVDTTDMKTDSIYAIVTMVNSRVIKAAVNPLDSGEYPYDVMPWQRVAGQWWGVGVSRQIRPCQQQLNAANRNLMDNAGLSGGPLLIVRQNMIVPADGDWTLRPRKIFYTTQDADVRTVNDAITAVNIPSMQAELMNIIQFAMKTAELVTGFPLLMQGQANPGSAPDTYGGQVLATNNASTVLRHIARTYDGCITKRHIKRYYHYLLEYGEDEREKGDFEIVARGSAVLVEREIQAQEQLQLLQMSANPSFGLNPKKVMTEWFKSRRFDPRKFQYSDEEMAQLSQQGQQPPPVVQVAQIKAQAEVQAAQIRSQAQVQVVEREAQLEVEAAQSGHLSPQMAAAQATIASAQIRAEAEMAKEQYRSNSELAYADAQARMAQVNDLASMRELELKKEIELLKYATQRQLSLDQVKADLAKETIRAQTAKDLAAAKMQMDKADSDKSQQHDAEKHVSNIISNQETAAAARRHEAEQRRQDREQEMVMKAQELEALKSKVQDVPGKKF